MELCRRHQRPRARGRSLRLRRRPAPRMRPSTAREGETSRAHAISAAPKPQTHCAHQWHAVSTDLHRPATATRAPLPVHLCFSAVALRARAAGWRAESCPHLFKPSLFSFSFQLELLRARALFDFPSSKPVEKSTARRAGPREQEQEVRYPGGILVPPPLPYACGPARWPDMAERAHMAALRRRLCPWTAWSRSMATPAHFYHEQWPCSS